MDFVIGEELTALRKRVRAFVDERVIPVEDDIIREDQATANSATLKALQAEARAEGLWTPHLPVELGGLGLGVMGMCALFREMGRSVVGARVFHCDAPDQGNMDLLLKAGSEAIKSRFLQPLVQGEITSAFCMTEPAPGAGSDPSNLRTRAVRDGDGWVIDGHKWYSTGGNLAAFLIIMARTSDDPRHGASMFVVDRHAAGVNHLRDIEVMGPPLLAHREAEFRFEGVRVDADALLGREGDGFLLAQQRLVPARLTHCMRWLGQAARVLEMSRAYLMTRKSFGRNLSDHQLVQRKIAANAMAIHQGNLMTLHCATLLEQGEHSEARTFSSMAKTHVARTLCQVLDDAIQLHGSLGYSEDLPFATWYRWARAARIADGPDEVHEMVVARDFFRERYRLLV